MSEQGSIDTERVWATVGKVLVFGSFVGALIYVVVPSSCRATESNRRVKSISALREVARALDAYLADNDGRYPFAFSTHQDLRSAVLKQGLDEQYFEIDNPVSTELMPNEELAGAPRDAILYPEDTVSFSTKGYWYSDGSRTVAFVDGHVKTVRNFEQLKWKPYLVESRSPLPAANAFSNAMSYKFTIHDEAYLLSWVQTRTYELEIEHMVEGHWRSEYTGVTMAKPIVRQGPDRLTLYLHQPWFQLGENGPPPEGKEHYEVVTVTLTGVHWTQELLDEISDQQP